MSKEYKNYAVPLEAVEILFLPALRRLSRAVPRTVADISQSLSEQTHALGTKEELQDLKSDAFMYQDAPGNGSLGLCAGRAQNHNLENSLSAQRFRCRHSNGADSAPRQRHSPKRSI